MLKVKGLNFKLFCLFIVLLIRIRSNNRVRIEIYLWKRLEFTPVYFSLLV